MQPVWVAGRGCSQGSGQRGDGFVNVGYVVGLAVPAHQEMAKKFRT